MTTFNLGNVFYILLHPKISQGALSFLLKGLFYDNCFDPIGISIFSKMKEMTFDIMKPFLCGIISSGLLV